MPAKDLGVKHTCWKCATKFYDLKKPDAVCPKCGSDPKAAPVTKSSPPAERRRVKEVAVEEVAETVDESDLDEDLDDDDDDEPDEKGDDA
jgi:hypothetical protein